MSTEYFDKAAAEWDQQDYRQHRLEVVARAMEKEIPLNGTMKGLDFGCGTGLLGFQLIDKIGHMTFLDTSEGMIEQIRRKGKSFPSDRLSWQVRDIVKEGLEGRYDLIVSMMSLHHVPDAMGAVALLAGSLERGGHLGLCDLVEEDGTFHGIGMDIPHLGFSVKALEDHQTRLGLKKVSSTTPFVNRKEVGGEVREYPLFLTVFRKD